MIYSYTFKTIHGETVSVRACDPDQARILAVAYYGKDYLRATLVSIDNKEDK